MVSEIVKTPQRSPPDERGGIRQKPRVRGRCRMRVGGCREGRGWGKAPDGHIYGQGEILSGDGMEGGKVEADTGTG